MIVMSYRQTVDGSEPFARIRVTKTVSFVAIEVLLGISDQACNLIL